MKFSSALVMDTAEQLQGPGEAGAYWMRGVKSLRVKEPVMGSAYPISVLPTTDPYSDTRRQTWFDILDHCPHGSVPVIVVRGTLTGAVLGDVVAARLRYLQIPGAIVDGVVRDLDAIASLGFSVWAKEVSMVGANPGRFVATAETSVTSDGTLISRGDLIIADTDGVVVVPQTLEQAMLELGRYLGEAEELSQHQVESGAPLVTAYPSKADLVKSWRQVHPPGS